MKDNKGGNEGDHQGNNEVIDYTDHQDEGDGTKVDDEEETRNHGQRKNSPDPVILPSEKEKARS